MTISNISLPSGPGNNFLNNANVLGALGQEHAEHPTAPFRPTDSHVAIAATAKAIIGGAKDGTQDDGTDDGDFNHPVRRRELRRLAQSVADRAILYDPPAGSLRSEIGEIERSLTDTPRDWAYLENTAERVRAMRAALDNLPKPWEQALAEERRQADIARPETIAARAAKAAAREAVAADRQTRLDPIRQDAIAAREREERDRAARRTAEKATRRIVAERRAAGPAERKARALALWPRKRAFAGSPT